MKRVLVLRAKEDIPNTAKKLRQRGFEVVRSPVLKVVATGEPLPAGPFDAVLATSEKGLEFAPADAAAVRALPLLVVGAKTARYAATEDWRSDIVAENVAGLLQKIAAKYSNPAHFLYLAGRSRQPTLEIGLKDAGHMVSTAQIYEARAEQRLWKDARALIAEDGIDFALHYSRRSASIFLNLARSAKLANNLRNIKHLALSDDVAAPLRLADLDVQASPSPDENSLLALLPQEAA